MSSRIGFQQVLRLAALVLPLVLAACNKGGSPAY
jgi:hypothetical protein